MAKIKTYGVTHLVDWVAQINCGKAKLIVHFEGGAKTKQGNTPAEYTTSNKIYQTIIENSNYYNNGVISLLREVGEDDEPINDTPVENATEAKNGGNTDGTTIEATCREDVVEYLKQKFGYTSVQLRTKGALNQALADHNLNVEGVEL